MGRRTRVLLCASGTSFIIMLDSNIVAVSLPSIAHELKAAFAEIEWILSAYIVTFAALLMPAGALADRFGRRRLLAIGLLLFTLSSLLCGLAPTPLILNSARALQGVGAAFQLSAALAVLGHEFRGVERAKAFGSWGSVVGVAVAVGPPIGGIITSYFGWRWAFLVNVPIGFVLIGLLLTAVEESSDPDARKLDVIGMVCFGAALFCLVWALIDIHSHEASNRPALIRLGIGAALLLLFVGAELVQTRPMIDFDLLRGRTFLGSAVAMLGFAGTAQVMMTYLPLYFQNASGFTPASAGLAMLPFAVPLFLCPRIGAALALHVSGRALLTLGLVLVAAGNLATAAAVSCDFSFPFVAIAIFMTGCGAGLLAAETAKVSISVVPPERGGMASGVAATLRFIGLIIGVVGLGAILSIATEDYLLDARLTFIAPELAGERFQSTVSRIVAGDAEAVVSQLPKATQATVLDMLHQSFVHGFTDVLLVATALAALAAATTYWLVSAAETAPIDPPAATKPKGRVTPEIALLSDEIKP